MSRQDLRDLEVVDGYLNIKDDDWFQQQFNNSAEEQALAQKFETRFIDEVYGTEGGRWEGDGLPTAISGQEDARIDYRRVIPDGVEVGTPAHYEAITRGAIDWASYRDDPAYQKAFKDFDDAGNANNLQELFGFDQDDSTHGTEEQRLAFIEHADAGGAARGDYNSGGEEEDTDWDNNPDNPNSWWNKWDNKYTHVEDPNKAAPQPQTAFTPSSASDVQSYSLKDKDGNVYWSSTINETARTDIANPSEIGSRRDTNAAAARAGITIRRVNVNKPNNIPADWGSAT
tara:strand:- start:637 stop:1494 length:858 start_codon:yes stop_codon:yes gene_type:complete